MDTNLFVPQFFFIFHSTWFKIPVVFTLLFNILHLYGSMSCRSLLFHLETENIHGVCLVGSYENLHASTVAFSAAMIDLKFVYGVTMCAAFHSAPQNLIMTHLRTLFISQCLSVARTSHVPPCSRDVTQPYSLVFFCGFIAGLQTKSKSTFRQIPYTISSCKPVVSDIKYLLEVAPKNFVNILII